MNDKPKVQWQELPDLCQKIVFVVSLLDELKRDGLVEGGWLEVNPSVPGIHKEMTAAGVEPTREEIFAIIWHLQEAAASLGRDP